MFKCTRQRKGFTCSVEKVDMKSKFADVFSFILFNDKTRLIIWINLLRRKGEDYRKSWKGKEVKMLQHCRDKSQKKKM